MHIKRLLPFFGTALALMVISCERLEEPVPGASAEEIPLAHGRFISATATDRHVVTLWFEQEDKTLVGVRVNTAQGTIGEAQISIPRR